MQIRPDILKLGGSVITDKRSKKPVVRTSCVKRLAREIAHIYFDKTCKTRPQLILLYGAGSFGHPLAHKHQLSERALSVDALTGTAKTISSVHKLGITLTDIFLKERVPTVPLQTSSFMRQHNGKLIITNYSLIEDILSHGGIPLLGGDVIIADHQHTTIASADAIASELAQHFHSRKLFFATDVNGVYEKFPTRTCESPLRLISKKKLQAMCVKNKAKKSSLDVTGAMAGKLHSLLPLRNCTVTIFNGILPNTLEKALCGETLGTRIIL